MDAQILKVNELLTSLQQEIMNGKMKQKIARGVSARGFIEQTLIVSEGVCDLVPKCEKSFVEARVFPGRELLARYCFGQLETVQVAVEVGVETGAFSRFILREARPQVLHLFDISFQHLADDVKEEKRCVRHRGDSNSLLPTALADASVDFAYIDGGHGYACVKNDIVAILPKMKAGGIIQFNDYTCFSPVDFHPYGVRRAVNELINEGHVRVVGVSLNTFGHDDLAVRLPEAAR